ncbi:hypothetical protein IAU60_005429 [Kwoniella sp. DSM 27419]
MTIAIPSIERVTFEHYLEPLGVNPSPRLSWRLRPGPRDWLQEEYEIELERTYHVKSSDSILVPWPGSPLASRERAGVSVRVKGNDGAWTEKHKVVVEAGIERDDWSAQFQSAPAPPKDSVKRPFRLRQVVEVSEVTHARLYISALGVYEATLNGQRIGRDVLAPGWTSYAGRLAYQTHDVTQHLQPGRNVLMAWVGEGWYSGRLGYHGGQRDIFGDRPALLAQLELDGEAVQSDWEWSNGAVLSSELYNGEVYDSTLPDTDEGGEWKPAEVFEWPSAHLFSSQSPPVREVRRVRPVSIHTTPSGKTIVDFGQNLGGVIRLLSQPPPGPELTMRHAEVLEHGELGTRPLRYAAATDRILLGGHLVGYMPRFTFHGFRYAEITGWDGVTLDDLEAVVLQSAMERTGDFTCSHELINRLHENAVWSTMGNTISIPSDCPQRDERLGWTGDVCVYAPTMAYLFNAGGFLTEWLQDLEHDQRKLDGVVPIFVPDTGTDKSTPEAIWGDAAVVVPHEVYVASGDTAVLSRQFDSIKLWLEQGVRRGPSGLWDRNTDQLGDWLAPRAPPETPNMGPTDNILVADAWLIHSTRTAAKIAQIIGQETEADALESQAMDLTEAFYDDYVTASGRLVSETQTALCLLLHFDIFPGRCKRRVNYKAVFATRLAQLVAKANWLIDTGFAGTPIVLPTLADSDHLDHAYRMLQATQCPSWLSPVLLGATTIWERWDSMLADGSINPGEMTSFNHYALGSVATFMHRYIGGLYSHSPGWQQVHIRPMPGGTITSARTSHVGPYGKVAVEWELVDGKLDVVVEVPPGCTARVELPGRDEVVGSGRRSYSVPYTLPSFPPPVHVPHFAPIRSNEWAA